MEKEGRVPGTGEEIVVQASDAEMPSPVHGLVQEAQEIRKRAFDFEESGHVVPPDEVTPKPAHVPRQTSRVVVQPRAGADPAWERAVGIDGPKIDGDVRKRARGETSSAVLRRDRIVEPSGVGDYVKP